MSPSHRNTKSDSRKRVSRITRDAFGSGNYMTAILFLLLRPWIVRVDIEAQSSPTKQGERSPFIYQMR